MSKKTNKKGVTSENVAGNSGLTRIQKDLLPLQP